VLKKDCLDLPDKIYKRRPLQFSDEQRRLYTKVRDQSIMELRQEDTTIQNVLVKYLRLQQIMGGWIPSPETDMPAEPIFESPDHNPRIKAMLDVIEENPGQRVIIWARFRAEIEAISDILNKEYPKKAVRFYGSTDKDEREENIYRFQGSRPIIDPETHMKIGEDICPDEERADYFVANQHSGGYGLTLTAATLVIYYSNDFSLEARLQSEDRAHRIGQTNKVLYVDLEVANSLDKRILSALKDKKKLADTVVGDDPSEWF
jgi:SNF2 family DNA or RNA helicase